MTGFLNTLVARGAGLPAPGGQVPLLPRPMARFEPGGGGWDAAGGPGREATFAAMEESSLAMSTSDPPVHGARNAETEGERFRATLRPQEEPRSARGETGAAALRPEVPAESTGPRLDDGPPSAGEASEGSAAPASIDAIRAASSDGPKPEPRPSGPRPDREPPSSAPSLRATEAYARVATPTSTELPAVSVPAAQLSLGQEAPPPISISIGRVTVEVVEPTRAPTQPGPPGPQRTRGFDAYARARRGQLR